MKHSKNLSVVLGIVSMAACAEIKPIARTANDIARELCFLTYGENPEALKGLTLKEVCAADKIIAPILDQILAAKKMALARAAETQAPAAP